MLHITYHSIIVSTDTLTERQNENRDETELITQKRHLTNCFTFD